MRWNASIGDVQALDINVSPEQALATQEGGTLLTFLRLPDYNDRYGMMTEEGVEDQDGTLVMVPVLLEAVPPGTVFEARFRQQSVSVVDFVAEYRSGATWRMWPSYIGTLNQDYLNFWVADDEVPNQVRIWSAFPLGVSPKEVRHDPAVSAIFNAANARVAESHYCELIDYLQQCEEYGYDYDRLIEGDVVDTEDDPNFQAWLNLQKFIVDAGLIQDPDPRVPYDEEWVFRGLQFKPMEHYFAEQDAPPEASDLWESLLLTSRVCSQRALASVPSDKREHYIRNERLIDPWF